MNSGPFESVDQIRRTQKLNFDAIGGKVRPPLPPLAVKSLEHRGVLGRPKSNRYPLVVIAVKIAQRARDIFEVGPIVVVAWRCFHDLTYVLIEAPVEQIDRELFPDSIKRRLGQSAKVLLKHHLSGHRGVNHHDYIAVRNLCQQAYTSRPALRRSILVETLGDCEDVRIYNCVIQNRVPGSLGVDRQFPLDSDFGLDRDIFDLVTEEVRGPVEDVAVLVDFQPVHC
jgi:hypothetical protein